MNKMIAKPSLSYETVDAMTMDILKKYKLEDLLLLSRPLLGEKGVVAHKNGAQDDQNQIQPPEHRHRQKAAEQVQRALEVFFIGTIGFMFHTLHMFSPACFYSKHARMASMTFFCCSGVILLSLGRHRPRSKMSAPTSWTGPTALRPEPETVMNSWSRYMGCMCMGFQMGRPSALYAASFSKISVGQLFPASL